MSAPDANAWQHIDTAPRDGTRIWLRLDTGAGPMGYIGRIEYIGRKHQDQSPRSGWLIEQNGYLVSLTHWQPIQPATDSEAAK